MAAIAGRARPQLRRSRLARQMGRVASARVASAIADGATAGPLLLWEATRICGEKPCQGAPRGRDSWLIVWYRLGSDRIRRGRADRGADGKQPGPSERLRCRRSRRFDERSWVARWRLERDVFGSPQAADWFSQMPGTGPASLGSARSASARCPGPGACNTASPPAKRSATQSGSRGLGRHRPRLRP